MDVGLAPGVAIAMLLGLLVGALLLTAVGGALLRLAVRWIAHFSPRYWLCCVAFLGAMVASVGIQWGFAIAMFLVLRAGAGPGWVPPGLALQIASIVGGFAISTSVLAGVSHLVLRAPDGRQLPIGQAFGAAAVCVGAGTVVYVLLAAAMVFALGGLPGGWH